MKPDKIEALIGDIAARHGIAVGRDDPILILQTINERLMQESAAAQQETLDRFKEAMLAYFILWRNAADPQPWNRRRVDRAVEAFLHSRAGLTINFEIADALHKLHVLGLLEGDEDGPLRVLPIDQALATLRRRWDDAM